MKTAVQLREPGDGGACAALVYGEPDTLIAGSRGPIAIFPSGQVIGYLLRSGRRQRLYVLRTLDVDGCFGAAVPGVRPRTRVLLEAASANRVRRVRGLLGYLVRRGPAPSMLHDGFYLRVGALLGGRLPSHKVLLSLLSEARRSA